MNTNIDTSNNIINISNTNINKNIYTSNLYELDKKDKAYIISETYNNNTINSNYVFMNKTIND